MKIELIDKDKAFNLYLKLKDLAFAIAEANGTLPGYSTAPECKLFNSVAGLTQLRGTEVCVFIDDAPAIQLTDFEFGPGQFFLGPLCGSNIKGASIENGNLLVEYFDGVIVQFEYVEEIEAWKFLKKNISIDTNPMSPN